VALQLNAAFDLDLGEMLETLGLGDGSELSIQSLYDSALEISRDLMGDMAEASAYSRGCCKTRLVGNARIGLSF